VDGSTLHSSQEWLPEILWDSGEILDLCFSQDLADKTFGATGEVQAAFHELMAVNEEGTQQKNQGPGRLVRAM
jgi:hypothetical protein